MSSFKVAYLFPGRGIGGTEKSMLRLFPLLKESNVSVSVLLMRQNGDFLELLRDQGTPCQCIPILDGNPFLVAKLIGQLKAEAVDLIQIFGFSQDVMMRPLFSAFLSAKVISSIRNTDPWKNNFHSMLLRLTRRYCSAWISNSMAGMEAAMERQELDPLRAFIVYNGIDLNSVRNNGLPRTQARYRLGLNDKDIVIGNVAHLSKQKGHKFLFQTINSNFELRRSNIKYLLIGKDFSNGEILRLALQMTGANISVLGPRTDIYAILSALDIFILPSLWEGLPTAVLEAMAVGLPVIASDTGGLSELIDDGVDGFLFPVGAHKPFSKKLIQLIEDVNLRDSLGQKARKKVEAKFCLNQMLENYLRTYKAVLVR